MKAICASVNFDLFMVLPRPTARIAHAAKLEFSSNDRSENREAGHKWAMHTAFEMAREALQLDEQSNLAERVAKTIVEVAKTGERNSDLLCECVLREFRRHL